ncbi:unnamed protein product [Polarella glacialis]|uniref:Phospholipid scramblase n=1 Tax=Polarella glacialis TaxID=89957 RepID=A0A813DYT4_POLGL|nr:unnamed protein product [Polarella glacialis]
MTFLMPADAQADSMIVQDAKGGILVKVSMDWPDPFRPGTCGIAATVRMQSCADVTLATVVARNVATVGQGLALCRAGCDSFGFVEPDGPRLYHVRHRTGVHLMTLCGDFGSTPEGFVDIEGTNPVGAKVCSLKKLDDGCHCWVLQHFDAGLVICSLLAIQVHRRLHALGSKGGPTSPPHSEEAVDSSGAKGPSQETSATSVETTSATFAEAVEVRIATSAPSAS